jgi:hypothetical protein
MIDFDTVRKLAREIGDVEESPGGAPALKAAGKLLAWTPTNKSAEPNSLAVRIGFDQRAELLDAAPDIYYVPGHYANYPTVLARLDRIHPDALKGLLAMAWKSVNAKPARAARKRRSKP